MKYISSMGWLMKKGMSQTCYRFFSTLPNPTRLAALEKLMEGPMSVTELAEALNQEQSMVSHNLRPLADCRFVMVEREGKTRRYSVNRETMEVLFDAVENHAKRNCPAQGRCSQLEG